ncbi:DUF1294 domain-containing protein [Bacillus sp. T33-2]|uniref:DUF1294 domain-containing protein n=1 Tax=Bacillus sp. T33-2 TaxID=2054168 RepID=UPI000C77DCA1|nr:DUF1294 domain-containing protein [Bacillus sp. T33-2]PLR98096.1 DUF1294 domain-containing protein [Bacillus sp. T33-2]
MTSLQFVVIYFIFMNLLGFYIMGADKKKAQMQLYRIKESTLFLVAFLGGAIGATFGMQFYRHKTKHLQFKLGLPLLSVLNFAGYLYFIQLLR